MLAFRLERWGEAPRLVDVPEPVPAAGDLVLQVTAAGLCHSDVHLAQSPPDGAGRSYAPPFTLGHEIAGRVVAIGPGGDRSLLDSDVVVYAPLGCGDCARCRAGAVNYCVGRDRPTAAGIGLGRDGGMAPWIVVPTDHVLSADGIAPELAAPLCDAALTPYHAISPARALIEAGGRVLVVGAGGLGHVAVQILRAFGAEEVVVVDRSPEALARQEATGFGVPVLADEELDARLDALGRGRWYDVVLDFVGVTQTIETGARRLRPGGLLAIVGSAGGSVEVRKRGLLPPGAVVTLPYWGGRADLEGVLAMAREGRIDVHTQQFTLEQAPEALAALTAGELRGRGVLVPAGSHDAPVGVRPAGSA